MTGRLAGAVASCLGVLAGLWLLLAPFALGAQPSGADWTDETWTSVASGAGLVVLGVIGAVAYAAAIRQHLVERGLVVPRPKRVPVAPPPAAAASPAAAEAPAGGDPELRAMLAPLVAALTHDLDRERTGTR
ncbi:MAG: hypothetical protein GEV10_07790 [Streptosporangiales bacterium]|nr:hypothetical protein [Streptosporangiales bacterium]